MKKGQIFFFPISFSLLLVLLSSCAGSNSKKAEILLDFKHSVQDAEDFKNWVSVLKERGGHNGEVNFVFDNDEFRAYILADQELVSSMKDLKGKNNFSCSESSRYCSLCINLKDMSIGCKAGKDGDLGSERAVIASNQKATLKDIIVAGEKQKETRIFFTGYPAELMFSKLLPQKCKGLVSQVMKSLSLVPKKRKDVSCVTDKKEVVCQALINVRRI